MQKENNKLDFSNQEISFVWILGENGRSAS